MRIWMLTMVCAVTTLSSACQREPNDVLDIPVQIEAQVREQRPDLDLNRYARFYARETGDISAVYVLGGTNHQGRNLGPGTITWVPVDGLPVIMDGGCSVVNVRYNEETKSEVSVFCNGDA